MTSSDHSRDHSTNHSTDPARAASKTPRRKAKRKNKATASAPAPIPMPKPEFACPDWLDDKAKDKFHQLVAQLGDLGILERTDVNALVRYADAHARWLEAALFVRQHGVSYAIKNDAGEIKSFGFFPQATQYAQLATMLLKLEQELGLTPSARTRIRAEHSSAMSGPGFHATAFQQQRIDELKRRLSLGPR